MTNSDVLDIYINMQQDIIFNRLIKIYPEKAVIAFCKNDDAVDWNFALIKKILSKKEVENLEKEFLQLKRTPSIYFENKHEFYPFKELLEVRGYKESYKDAWMFYKTTSVDLPQGYQVKKVYDEKDIEIFLEIFNKSYQKNDPQNPYGEWGKGYLKTISDSWYKHHSTQKVECFIFYKDEEPVAVSELVNYKDMGYITNVASMRHVRGQGFGKLATLHCVKRSLQRKHTYHFLATEEGQYPHKFYQKIGFKTEFTAVDYAKR